MAHTIVVVSALNIVIRVLIVHYSPAGYTGMDQGSFPTDGTQGGSDIDPGSMGQMASSASSGGYGGGGGADEYGESGFEEELPLLVELGIDFNMIKQKVCFD